MDKGSLSATGIAELSRLIPNLKLLFLNGCHNVAQVRLFAKAGVPAIIATSRLIDDQQALQFGIRFYHNLIANQGITHIVNAFEAAKAEVKALSNEPQLYRSLDIRNNNVAETTWAWALYTTSKQAEQWHLNEAIDDPCFALPPLPPQDLPVDPFRDLYFFREQDAEVFFGRCQQISDIFHRLTNTVNPSDPVLLLHGRSGVGKSSFLAAGLVPRLKAANNEVHYLRYDPLLGALGCLQQVLEHDDIVSAWREWENREQKPLIIILDQLEEVFTLQASAESFDAKAGRHVEQIDQPVGSSRSQLVTLVKALLPLFAAKNHDLRPQGKLILSFRKEWLAEILSICNQYELPNSDYFLKALQRANIIDAVEGVTRQPRLKQKYRLSIKNTSEAKLSDIIADDLLADEESNIAPTLQILLSKLWRKVKAKPQRCFAIEYYNQLRKEGLLLDDHFDQQLDHIATLKPWGEAAKNSGLLLDILHAHTTSLGTAQSISVAHLAALYPHIDNLTQLIEALKNRYLLINVFDNETSELKSRSTRLSHDTLAALVRKRFENSVLPGQRARRLLDNRKDDWYKHDEDGNLIVDAQGQCLLKKTGTALGRSDLKVAEQGRWGTRVWDHIERRLVHKSQRRRYLFWGRNVIQIASLAGLLVFAAFYTHYSKNKMEQAQAQEQATLSLYLSERALQISQLPGKLRGYQDRALLLALQALKYNVDNQTQKSAQKAGQYGSLSQILYADNRLPPHTFQQDSSFASSANQRFFASFSSDHRLSLWQSGSLNNKTMQARYYKDIDTPITIKKLLFSPAARYLVGLSKQGQLMWWQVDNGTQLNHPPHDEQSTENTQNIQGTENSQGKRV